MASITYDNHITTVPEGKVATLPCNGQIMKSDIVISADAFAILNYNGVTTPIEEGKTATLPCKGKFMGGDISVDTKRCLVVIYAEDDTTVLDKVALTPDCTVSVTTDPSGKWVQLAVAGSDGERHTATYRPVTGKVLDGVSETYYYQTRYEDGDSFSLEGRVVHCISIRKLRVSAGEDTVLFLGLGYVDGIPCYAPTPAITWEEWVTYKVGTYAFNEINAQIIDGYVYTEDGKKVLYTADGKRVKSTDLVENNYAQYTFAEVAG